MYACEISMELKRFDKAFNNLTMTFRKGFYKKPKEREVQVFGKIVDFQLQASIIRRRYYRTHDIYEIYF